MVIDKNIIEKLLPEETKKYCLIGICNPLYLEIKKRVLCEYIPIEFGGQRWSAKPSEVLPCVKSIICLIHFTPIAVDYFVDDIILTFADILWKRLRIRTHVLNRFGKPCKENLVGYEHSFLKISSYDAKKRGCRVCQSFCPINSEHYVKNSLVVAMKERKKRRRKIIFFSTKETVKSYA